jgi:hypothetical protein
MKNLLILYLFFSTMNSNYLQTEKLKIDSSKIVVLEFKPDYYWLFKNVTNSKLNNAEISKIEKMLQEIV